MKIKLFALVLIATSWAQVAKATTLGIAMITMTGVVTQSSVPAVVVGQKFFGELGILLGPEEFKTRTFGVGTAIDQVICPLMPGEGSYACIYLGSSTPQTIGGTSACFAGVNAGLVQTAQCEGQTIDSGGGYFDTTGFARWDDFDRFNPVWSGIVTDTRIQFLPEPSTGILIGLALVSGSLASRYRRRN